VHLVGIGPGDPELLTRRAARLIGQADILVVDRPSAAAVTALAPPGAEVVHVGRTADQAAWPPAAIIDLLVQRARTGRLVVRLKSGDPFVCSRGGEELDALASAGVDCQVTPGVSAATAAPLAAAMPRGTRVVVASGAVDIVAAPVPWDRLADPASSLVVLTGREHQGRIAAALRDAGLPSLTPAAVVSAAYRAQQSVHHTTLDGLGALRLPPPAAFVVGPVVGPANAPRRHCRAHP
jgi:siroheme synthase